MKRGKKILSLVLTFAMAIGLVQTLPQAKEAVVFAAEAEISSDATVYDFRDGSIIPTDTDGKSDVTHGDLTVTVGNKNAYQYNGAQHGVAFKAGNAIAIKVAGSVKVSVGDCAYSNMKQMTIKDASGAYAETKDTKTGCYHNDGSVIVFNYSGPATTLTIDFDNTTYVPAIIVEPTGEYFYDFRDGSVIPTDTDGKSDVTFGNMTITVGNKNAYKYNGAQHGVAFKAGNAMAFKVSGPTKITVGDCAYSNATSLTLVSADGTYSETLATKTGCYHNDGSALVFNYAGPATTLTLAYENTAYVPMIIVSPVVKEVGDNNGVPYDSFKVYNFSNGSVIAESQDKTNPLNGTVTSADGFLRVNSNGKLYAHDKDHGLAVFAGDTFDIDVAGDAVIALETCMYGTDANGTYTISSKKGKITKGDAIPAQITELDGGTRYFKYEGVATTLTVKVNGGAGEYYLHAITVYNGPEPGTEAASLNDKIEVWDFGAEVLDTEVYDNKLNADIINGFYPGVEAGKSGVTISSFATEDIYFHTSGKTNNRFRTTNTALTRYDSKHLVFTEEDGTETDLTGYLYSNSGSSPRISAGVKLYANDWCTMYLGTNSGDSTIVIEGPDGVAFNQKISHDGAKVRFAAPCDGLYKVYSTDEKLVVYRILREHSASVQAEGKITVPENMAKDYTVAFKNVQTGAVTEVTPEDGKLSFTAYEGYSYEVSLLNANGFVITSGAKVTATKGAKTLKCDVTVKNVPITTVTGKISGLSEEALGKVKLSFVNEKTVYVPTVTISGDTYTAALETGVIYTIKVEGVDDYRIEGYKKYAAGETYKIQAGDNLYTIAKSFGSDVATFAEVNDIKNPDIIVKGRTLKVPEGCAEGRDITLALKTLYHVKLNVTGLSNEAKKNLTFTFTNLETPSYVYTFNYGEDVILRNGQYSVKATGTGDNAVVQGLTANAIVKNSNTKLTVPFDAVTSWDFSKLNAGQGGPGIESDGINGFCAGLVFNNQVLENKTYLLLNGDGKIWVPVKKGDVVTLSYCYCADFIINDDEATIVDSKSGSTSKIEKTVLTANETGYITIKSYEGTNGKQTYFTSIDVLTPVKYAETVYVGKNKTYKTINAALADIRKMDRTAEDGTVKRVTVVIEPGNYEEMLLVDVPNVTFLNAAGDDASIALKNEGVDIADNAVRITSYYGHGYSYYSMGADYRSDDKVLAVNKANGKYSVLNPGAGTGTYWNSTVVISGSGFEAKGIIFENSFNQYISEREAKDIIVLESGNKGLRSTTVGDTSVQARDFVERAGALSLTQTATEAYFENCKFVGRQDTLYGGVGATAAFEKCSIYGAVDFIYGGMTAVFDECDLVMNTDYAKSSDIAYITAAQQSGGRGFLFMNCTVTSTNPGFDTASVLTSKPGYFGRPWAANTSEVVFYNTVVETTDFNGTEESLILPIGWLDSLGGKSSGMYEFNTVEESGADNSAERASWSTVLKEAVLNDGTDISTREKAIAAFLGDWTPIK